MSIFDDPNIILGYPHLKNALNTSEYNNKVLE